MGTVRESPQVPYHSGCGYPGPLAGQGIGDDTPQGTPMTTQQRAGRIEVVAGVMFSGKSEELIRRVRRALIARKRVQVFKSHLDARYAGIYAISSHDGRTIEARPVDSSHQIGQMLDPAAQVIAIDEAQFLDVGVVRLANHLASR